MFRLKFLSPEGEELDSLDYESVHYPLTLAADNGYIAAFVGFGSSDYEQQVIWFDLQGQIVYQRDDFSFYAQFAYLDGDTVFLLEEKYFGGEDITLAYYLHGVRADGDTPSTVLLHQEGVTGTEYTYPLADWSGETLAVCRVLVDPYASEDYISFRMILRTEDEVIVGDPCFPDFGPGMWSSAMTLVPAGGRRYIITHCVMVSGTGILGYRPVAADGTVSESAYEIPFLANQSPAYIAAGVLGGTIYSLLATLPTGGQELAGAYLMAFPLNNVMSSPASPAPLPERFALEAYPNPFNASVRLRYELPRLSPVELKIFDVTGRLIAVPLAGVQPRGTHEITWTADGLPSGVYFAALHTPSRTVTGKLLLVR